MSVSAIPIHLLRQGAAAFEDGTPPFQQIVAIPIGFRHLAATAGTFHDIHSRATYLAALLRRRLADLRHPNGAPVVRLYCGYGAGGCAKPPYCAP